MRIFVSALLCVDKLIYITNSNIFFTEGLFDSERRKMLLKSEMCFRVPKCVFYLASKRKSYRGAFGRSSRGGRRITCDEKGQGHSFPSKRVRCDVFSVLRDKH